MGSGVKLVGPVLRGMDADLVDGVVEAIIADNPGIDVSVDDQGGYVRVGAPMRCRLTRASLEEALGRPFPLAQLEPSLSSFAWRMQSGDDEMVWFLSRED